MPLKAVNLPARFTLLWIGSVALLLGSWVAQGADDFDFFEKKIRPVLVESCYQCHSAMSEKHKGGLLLDSRAGMLKGGESGKPTLVPRNAAKSLLIEALHYQNEDLQMPPKKKLTDAQIADFVAWVNMGAPDPRTNSLTVLPPPPATNLNHWAFQPPQPQRLPKVKTKRWAQSPIDNFILAKLEEAKLKPALATDKRTLLRRVTIDLTGLPPTPEEMRAFVNDSSRQAFSKVVDRLLASPAYGERWARHWLDVVRYAESNGYERDGTKTNAWRYRDYVIDSLNRDKPFDRFLTEQIAGDEIPDSNAETQIATTFLRLGTWDDEPADILTDRYDQLDDVLGATATTFLGQTIRCARCHDHKFEPFSQVDYYRLLAVFEPLQRPQVPTLPTHKVEFDRMAGRESELAAYRAAIAKADAAAASVQKLLEELKRDVRQRLFASKQTALPPEALAAFEVAVEKRNDAQKELVKKFNDPFEQEILNASTGKDRAIMDALQLELASINDGRPKLPPFAYVWYEDSPKAAPTHLFRRGQPTKPAEEVAPGFPAVLVHGACEPPKPLANSSGRRLWLARWMTRPDNPLVARVLVNRVWQWHFGEGLVATENDFGVMGQKPSHPELLDWLAREFVASGWSLKHLHKLIVGSSTYQMSSQTDTLAQRIDPDDRLLWRWKPRRQEAEALRDSILMVSGQLNSQRGGPSIYPHLPQSVLAGQTKPGDGWGKSSPQQVVRRSIYIFVKRSLAVPELEVLDAPDTSSSCEQRTVSTTGPQALTFLNGEFIQQQVQQFAARLRREVGDEPGALIRRAFELALGREPRHAELSEALEFLTAQRIQIETDAKVVSQDARDEQRKALEALCLVILNTNEYFYLN